MPATKFSKQNQMQWSNEASRYCSNRNKRTQTRNI